MQPTFCYKSLPGLKEEFTFPWMQNRPMTLETELLRDRSFVNPFLTAPPGCVPCASIQQKAEGQDRKRYEEFDLRFHPGVAPGRPKSKRFSMTYVALIASAILRSPEKRLTLAQIYQVIEKMYPEFTVSRAGWKNTVRHNLSLHECFVKGDVAANGKSCFWHIHPAYMARFSKGDFRKRPSRELCPLEDQRGCGPRLHWDRMQPGPMPCTFGAGATRFADYPYVGERHSFPQGKFYPGSSNTVQKSCVSSTLRPSTEWLSEYKPYPYYYLFSPRNASLQQTDKNIRADKPVCSTHWRH